MTRALDDILIGFLIFFSLDRSIRLISGSVVEPWAKDRTTSKSVIENWKIGAELAILLISLAFVVWNQKAISRLNRT